MRADPRGTGRRAASMLNRSSGDSIVARSVSLCRPSGHNLKPGPVRRSAVSLDAAPPRDGMTGRERAAGNLLGEPGLADARFADDEHEPPHPSAASPRAERSTASSCARPTRAPARSVSLVELTCAGSPHAGPGARGDSLAPAEQRPRPRSAAARCSHPVRIGVTDDLPCQPTR
jgi:hypothetical protein